MRPDQATDLVQRFHTARPDQSILDGVITIETFHYTETDTCRIVAYQFGDIALKTWGYGYALRRLTAMSTDLD